MTTIVLMYDCSALFFFSSTLFCFVLLGKGNAIRNWEIQGRVAEGMLWKCLQRHIDDKLMGEEPGTTLLHHNLCLTALCLSIT
jgi:hypothetical protein